MSQLNEICKDLDECFTPGMEADYSPALNGLQVENKGRVTKVGAAVDASESTIDKAMAEGVDLLIVHHGLFWSGPRPVTGANYRKMKKILDSDMAVYSMHLPLDGHEEWGNSLLLGKELGLKNIKPGFEQMGHMTGIEGEWAGTLADLIAKLGNVLDGSVHVSGHGPREELGKVAIISGGAGSELESVYRRGILTYISGEGAHWTAPLAEELGMNLIYAGHYATETFGVKAVAEHVARKYNLPWVFLPNPTGL